MFEQYQISCRLAQRPHCALCLNLRPAQVQRPPLQQVQMAGAPVGPDRELVVQHAAHDQAREWGLYISTSRGMTSIGIEEPARFSEPGVFLVRPDGTLYYGAVQTMPFARPHFDELLAAIDFALAKDYPARGEYTGAV